MALDYYSLDYDSFLKWALIKEPTLKEKKPLNELPEDITPSGISDYTYQQTTMAFEEALNRCASLKRYMRDFNYINLIFNYALHISIVSSAFEIKKDDDTEGGQTSGNIWNEPTEPLQKLYVQYSVYDSTAGILTSTSSGGSSSSVSLPKSLTEGDLETSYLLSTPYGVQAEIYFEQVNGIII
ncbi:hypothetical protein NEI02_06555 [Brachyspira pilosicoli]|uniref:Uncharacterized protein n=1 Tax=Brachyspira pilosicoli TaxID=52584 RepID=A0AAJ6G9D1_BRAPL|nr:hypothetical protein [Brachyspira pilosicoli]WIH89365.1 hypothetical protein NEI02_06555 [Brachyspira pilosicoli]WIH91660.1 hypothetical protein NEI01_06555 [Brachyspira pilosicoli]WIH94528.1 hypothetical protein NEH99_09545 [Brachyspira pilosicoli]